MLRLRDRLAGSAAELLPHVLGHEPLPRDDIERLGDVLADLAEFAAAAAWTRGRRRVRRSAGNIDAAGGLRVARDSN